MSIGFLTSLAVVVVVVVGTRFAFDALPLRRAVPVTVTDAAVAGVGVVGLAFHCGAMFFRSLVEAWPGAATVISEIDALGTVSVIWYVVAAVLVLLGLRRQYPVPLAVAAVALIAVGVTMYDGGSLHAHLTAIFISVVVLAGVAATLVLPPWRCSPPAAQR